MSDTKAVVIDSSGQTQARLVERIIRFILNSLVDLRKNWIEVTGAVLAIIGTHFVAEMNGMGFVFYLFSNFLLITLFLKRQLYWLVLMQLAFTFESLRGIVNWLS